MDCQKPQTPCGNSRTSRSVATALTLPRLSCTLSVTVIGSHWLAGAGGRGGGGISVQFTAGIDSTGPVVVCENVVATP
jgi:hypothetical protein